MPGKVLKADIPKSVGSLGRKPFFSGSAGKGGWRNLIGPAQARGAVGGPGIGGELRFSELLNGVLDTEFEIEEEERRRRRDEGGA